MSDLWDYIAFDHTETAEWKASLEAVIRATSLQQAAMLVHALLTLLQKHGMTEAQDVITSPCNTLPVSTSVPTQSADEKRALSLIQWNAMMMVVRAGVRGVETAGHIATYASASTLIETGLNYFFHAPTQDHIGDLVFFQGHASPGLYARGLLEGRLSKERVDHFRQEAFTEGLSSYPHPWLMPDFWQFPTVSMGLGPLAAIYQARFRRYLENRGLLKNGTAKVWVFCGDGEMDEPESLGAINVAVREQLSNLVFIINCNQQRLDGPVRGNARVVDELERTFRGSGWRVIKVLWNEAWQPLFDQDHDGHLMRALAAWVDGAFQHIKEHDGAAWREHFFSQSPELTAMIEGWSDDELARLGRGGHDFASIYTAYEAAQQEKTRPVLLLPVTKKGYGMGLSEGDNTNHQKKKMTADEMKAFAQFFEVDDVTDEVIANHASILPKENDPARQFLAKRRQALGGALPARRQQSDQTLAIPPLSTFSAQLEGSGDREISTTMVFVRLLVQLLRDPKLAPHLVPIVPDESRTFGMEGLFRQIGIYSPVGQCYEPVDRQQIMYYREAKDGQLLEEGINEAGAMASWMAAASSYSNNNLPMIPFYIYYSMFGFQRVGDLWWAAADMRCRGFLLGAISGRTTLSGEGLQHQDGQTHLFASVIPNCIAYDPAYSYELAVIMHEGMVRMYERQEDVYYYLSLLNVNYHHPAMPEGAEEGIIRGMYCLEDHENAKVTLLASGALVSEAKEAKRILADDYDIAADLWSVTSYTELARDIQAHNHGAWTGQAQDEAQPYVTACLASGDGPVIAISDYVEAVPNQIREAVPRPYTVLGTDGFGRSDTRAALRRFFSVDAASIVYRTLCVLVKAGQCDAACLTKAQKALGLDLTRPHPMRV